jgi:hypothetical protein
MGNAFGHLRSIRKRAWFDDRPEMAAVLRLRRAKHAAAVAVTPMVIRVLQAFRDCALPQMDTYTQLYEDVGWYSWGIGARRTGPYFCPTIGVSPHFTKAGGIERLATHLHVPNSARQSELMARLAHLRLPGVNLDKGLDAGATRTCLHEPTETGLTEALIVLVPPSRLEDLLITLAFG